jgi:hypothetical protein
MTETTAARDGRHAAIRAQLMSDLLSGEPDEFDADVVSGAAIALTDTRAVGQFLDDIARQNPQPAF